MFFLSGVSAVLLGAVMPEFLQHYRATYAAGGRIVLVQAIGFIIGVPLSTRLANLLPRPKVLALSGLTIAVAQGALLTLPQFRWIYLVVICNGLGVGALETLVAPSILETFPQQQAIYMSRLEASFGLGALTLPALTGTLILLGHWQLSFLATGLLSLSLAFCWFRITMPEPSSETATQRDAPMSNPPRFLQRSTKILVLSSFLFTTVIYVGLEGSINNFLPALFLAGFKATAVAATLTSSTFWAFMVLGRLGIHWVAQHLRYDQYLWVSVSATVASLAILANVRSSGIGFLLVATLGLGMAAIYSLFLVYANHTFPGQTQSITSAILMMSGLGNAIFPATFGYEMDRLSIHDTLILLVGVASLIWIGLFTISLVLRMLRARDNRRHSTSEKGYM
ncbi:MFS transporter [Sulfobacillus harzensis]